MDIWIHTITSIILTGILWPVYGFWSLFAIVGGVLVDFDHLLWHIAKTKRINILKAYKYCKKIEITKDVKEYEKTYMIFHNYYATSVLAVLAIIIPYTAPLFSGYVLHMLLDYISLEYRLKFDFETLFKKSPFILLKKVIRKEKL